MSKNVRNISTLEHNNSKNSNKRAAIQIQIKFQKSPKYMILSIKCHREIII